MAVSEAPEARSELAGAGARCGAGYPGPAASATLKQREEAAVIVDGGFLCRKDDQPSFEEAVLNFSPGALQVPPDVKLKSVDLTVSLESLSFFLAQEQGDGE